MFRAGTDRIELLADRTRALPVNDPYDRELTISCGAALFNLTVAAAHHGLPASVELMPDQGDPDLLAVVRLGSESAADGELFDAIPQRHTTRDAFVEEPVSGELSTRLVGTVEGDDVWLLPIAGDVRTRVGELIAEGDRMQFGNPSWRRELASWMHPRRSGDGLRVPEVVGLVTKAVVTAFDLGGSIAGKDLDLVANAPFLGVLGTPGDGPKDWLRAGQALEKVLLTAAREGLSAGYLNQPCQVAELRPRLQQALGRPGHAQVVFRLGRPRGPATAHLRRPLEDIME